MSVSLTIYYHILVLGDHVFIYIFICLFDGLKFIASFVF
jgi:hypothetical protein